MKITFFAAATASAMLFVSATVWEGVTAMAPAKELPEKYTIATNAFPYNSVVEITNLENGKMVWVKVASGLETTGLLATLSRDAAEAIDLRDTFTCRVRISQPPDDIAFANFRLGPIASDEPQKQSAEAETESPLSLAAETESGKADNVSEKSPAYATVNTPPSPATETESGKADSVSDKSPAYAAVNTPPSPAAETQSGKADSVPEKSPAYTAKNMSSSPAAETQSGKADGVSEKSPAYTAVNTPPSPAAETQSGKVDSVPEKSPAYAAVNTPPSPAAETESGKVDSVPEKSPAYVAMSTPPSPAAKTKSGKAKAGDKDAEAVIADAAWGTDTPVIAGAVEKPVPEYNSDRLSMVPAEERLPKAANQYAAAPETKAGETIPGTASATEYIPPSDFSPFQAPLINRQEQGKCYVQVGAYTHPDYVENEINRIGARYPLAIQNIGTDTNPMFRVLLGPLNQGESEAMLQRFKSIGYTDAFVWYN